MDYNKQVGMIADFLKPFCGKLTKGDKVEVKISDYVTLSVSGGVACDIRIADQNPSYYKHRYYNEYTKWSSEGIDEYAKDDYADGKHSQYFQPFRDIPEHIARPLILNWKEIKQNFIDR